MYISNLKIKNFKCFDKVEIEFDPDFNLIIGENNSGKSTIFDALRLWQLAIQQFYTARTYKKSIGNIGFYRNFALQPLLINDLSFLRIEDLNEVLHKRINSSVVAKHFEIDEEYRTFIIELTFSNDVQIVSIPIQFKPNSRNTLNCKIYVENEDELKKISNLLSEVMNIAPNDTFRNRIRLGYIPPKFNLPNKEILLSERNNYIAEKLIIGESQYVIRNIIHYWAELNYQKKTKQKDENVVKRENQLLDAVNITAKDFETNFNDHIRPYIENVLGFTLSQRKINKSNFLIQVEEGLTKILNQNFHFKSFNNPLHNYTLQIRNLIDNSEISQLGSGTINVLNILCVMNYNEQTIDKASTKCNVLLLDEPDSHLHSNLQFKLFEYLFNQSNDSIKQFFIISHNSGLISQFSKVLYIKSNAKIISPISIEEYLENHLKNIDENHYNVIKSLNEAKREKEDVKERLKKISKPILICEGTTDVKILEIAYLKLYNQAFFKNTLYTNGGGGASSVNNFLQYNSNSEICLIGLFDRDKEGKAHFDRLQRDGKGFSSFNSSNFHCVKDGTNTNALTLPIPSDRNSEWFNENLIIEYLFTNDILEKCGVELELLDYMNFKIIKSKIGQDLRKDSDVEKRKILLELKSLKKEDFKHFIPLFEKIAEIIKFDLPKVEFDT